MSGKITLGRTRDIESDEGGTNEADVSLTVRQRIDLCNFLFFPLDPTQTSQSVHSINVHRTTSTNTFSTGSTEGEGGVDFILDFDLSVRESDGKSWRDERRDNDERRERERESWRREYL